ncbi:hypothetical protein SAMN05660293_00349 [Dyadobacter psychrophilus]|uniref:Uncharacterized protein n=1 Tax=Dyadobacter psychrophilus TaxID=651661 RepID=A0A1T5BIK6_9BACT|nr:hypothetical protein SAMN05660293_00349 [Dyadobacter psychrophilus]
MVMGCKDSFYRFTCKSKKGL